jgi:hypothetical protein
MTVCNRPRNASDLPYVVIHWGSHPDLDNDDNFDEKEFFDKDQAIDFFNANARQAIAYIEIDGLEDFELTLAGIDRLRPNPNFKPKTHQRDNSWQHEQAMEAGMLHGIDAYNDAMGYGYEPDFEPQSHRGF